MDASREDQVRWFLDVWEGAQELRASGVDLCAVTAWSLLGAHDWNRMVTRFIGHYETGVFDVRSGSPRPTLLARVLKEIAAQRTPDLPHISGPGWWRRSSRLIHAGPQSQPEYDLTSGEQLPTDASPLLILGQGNALELLAVRHCEARGLYYTRASQDAENVILAARPWAVLDARDHDALCGETRLSSDGTPASSSVAIAAAHSIPHAHISSVDGSDSSIDQPHCLEIRAGPMFMPWDHSALAVQMLDAIDAGQPITAGASVPWNQVYGPDVLALLLDMLLDGVRGSINLTPTECISELQFARALAIAADAKEALVLPTGARRSPLFVEWSCAPGYLPKMETTLERFVGERRALRLFDQRIYDQRETAVTSETAE